MIKIKKIKPLFTSIVTTMEHYGVDEFKGALIDPTKRQGMLKELQKVIAVGSAVRDIEVGDLVKINPARYAVRKYEENSVKKDLMENKIVGYNIPQIEIDGQTYLMLQNSDIEFVVTEYEEETPYSGLITEKKSLMIP